jgi:hypothetical protein
MAPDPVVEPSFRGGFIRFLTQYFAAAPGRAMKPSLEIIMMISPYSGWWNDMQLEQ